LLSEIFGVTTFDGWVEAEASASGLGIYTATGSWNMTRLDGAVARTTSSDFVLFHAGASATLVNPSPRPANVTLTAMGTAGSQSLAIPARGRITITVPGIVRVQSSEALAAVERSASANKLSVSAAVPASDAQGTVVFAYAIVGSGYDSTLSIANVHTAPQDVTVTLGAATATFQLAPNSAARYSLASLLQLPSGPITAGALRVAARPGLFGSSSLSLVGVLDIENPTGQVTMGARPASVNTVFPHVAHGNGLFTGLALATGDASATITIEVYDAAGTTPRSTTITLGANQQTAKLISEFNSAISTHMGGYIRIRSDQPIWAWEVYGSGEVMASGPPL
jgi:hypothetical protein